MPEKHSQAIANRYAQDPRFREISEALWKISAALWDRTDGQAAWTAATRLKLDGEIPAELLILLFTAWGQLAIKVRRMAEAEPLLRRARSLLSKDIPPTVANEIAVLEGVLAAFRGDMMRRERIYRESFRNLPPGTPEEIRTRISHAHFLALMGRESEVDAELDKLESLREREAQTVLLVRFIQAMETARFADAHAMSGKLRGLAWDISGHRAAFLNFLDIAVSRWGLVPGESGDSTVLAGAEPSALPSWAAVMDLLMNGRAAEALVHAKREAGPEAANCITKTGFDSFNLVRAELANGNWQAAVRLVSMRRARGNHHYLDDYFLAVACLLAGQRADAAAHFGRVDKACTQHDAASRLEFELRMAPPLRAADIYGLLRSGIATSAQPKAVPTPPRTPGPEVRGLARMVGPSPALAAVRDAILRVAQLDTTVLITGETGVGKELVARSIHETSPRSPGPFLAVNCGAIAENLLESELFGHEKGAFTGASGAHKGLFETAGNGTIFLDEIGEIPPRLQASLLRVLESGEIRPVGASTPRKTRCRVIAATNADLEHAMIYGDFRKDLYYRLARLAIRVPPLRERREDIVPLAVHFLAESRVDGACPRLSPALEEELRNATWPGNVRELRNTLERMRIFNSEKLSYELADLVLEPRADGKKSGPQSPARQSHARPALAGRSAEAIADFLKGGRTPMRRLDQLRELFRLHGKLTRAEVAEILGVTPKTATGDLQALCRQGHIEKVEPGPARRTHYFRVRATPNP